MEELKEEKEAKVGRIKTAENASQKKKQVLSDSFSFQGLKPHSCGERAGWVDGWVDGCLEE